MYDWKDCEYLIKKFRENNIANKNSTIYCEYKFGPLTTRRRNLALAERKKLKAEGEILGGYVAYPARLMVKTTAKSNYFMIKDFSSAKVEFGKRD